MRDYSKYSYNDTNNEVVNSILKNKKDDISQKKPFSPAIINKKSQEPSVQAYNTYNKNKYYDEDEQNQDANNENNEEEEDNDNIGENDDEENQDIDDDNEDGKEENGKEDEYEEGGELVQCTMGCGRKFNVNSIKKHMKICKKVFQSKRKVFDSSKARAHGVVEKVKVGKGSNNSKGNNQNKKNLWKKQSEAFRAMLKQNRQEPITEQDRNVFEEAQNLVLCNWCGRKFNDSAAQKHIPFCEKKSKMDKMKQQTSKRK